MQWSMVDNDMVAQTEELVFRIRYDVLGTVRDNKPFGYTLQLRKKKQTKFEDLGYHFITEYFSPGAAKINSIDGKIWNEKNDRQFIMARSERILLALGFIDEADCNTPIPEQEKRPSFRELADQVKQAAKRAKDD